MVAAHSTCDHIFAAYDDRSSLLRNVTDFIHLQIAQVRVLSNFGINHASAHQCLSKNKFLCRQRLRAAYERDFWDGARYTVAAIWDAHGWLWHGMRIII